MTGFSSAAPSWEGEGVPTYSPWRSFRDMILPRNLGEGEDERRIPRGICKAHGFRGLLARCRLASQSALRQKVPFLH